jgi:hypothetical protein
MLNAKTVQKEVKDVASFIQQNWKPILSKSFDFIKNSTLRFGFRVTKLQSNKTELVVPLKWNQDSQGLIMPGILVQAGCMAQKMCLDWIDSSLQILNQEIQSHFELDKINSDVRVRYYLDPVDQEILLSELSLNSKAELKSEILFFTSAERKVGSVHLITTIKGKFQLESQKV